MDIAIPTIMAKLPYRAGTREHIKITHVKNKQKVSNNGLILYRIIAFMSHGYLMSSQNKLKAKTVFSG